ncbi:hypothetical protein GGU11DRAFT_659858, partial [Lentinula aff. detonsa]
CNTIPSRRPVCTDHIPIHTIINVHIPYVDQRTRWNWAQTDWNRFKERTREEIDKRPPARELNNIDEFNNTLKTLDDMFTSLIDELVPKAKPSPYQGNLANKSHRKRHNIQHPVHGEYRQIRQAYNAEIKKAKIDKWVEYIENADTSSVW